MYSYFPRLEKRGGDQVSEIALLKSLAMRFDVYYNNQPFLADRPDFGFFKEEVETPNAEYDLVYVRSSKKVFLESKQRGYLTAYFGSYDPEIYAAADAIVTHNRTMRDFLVRRRRGGSVSEHFDKAFPSALPLPSDVLVLEQPGREDFRNVSSSRTARRLRMKWGDDFVLGFFGRIDDACMPRAALAAMPDVRHEIPRARFIMGGPARKGYEPLPEVCYERGYLSAGEMPHALSACDAIVGIEQPEADWSGSNRTLEAIRCGVPFLTMPYAARIEQLGEDYPLFYRTPAEFYQRILRLRYDPAFVEGVRRHLSDRSERASIAEIRSRNADEVSNFLERHGGAR